MIFPSLHNKNHHRSYFYDHRAVANIGNMGRRISSAAGLAIVMTGLWIGVLPWVGSFWGHILILGRDALHLPGRIVMTYYEVGYGFAIPIPYLDLASGDPSKTIWWITAIIVIMLFMSSFRIPSRFIPATYYLRAVLFVQSTALVYFFLFPGQFPFSLTSFFKGMISTSLFVTLLVPTVLGFTYFIFDFHLYKKVGLTVMLLAQMTMFIPLHYLAQAYLIYIFSLLFMPVLYLIFGVLIDVMIIIALYGWGMSWKARRSPGKLSPIASMNPSSSPHSGTALSQYPTMVPGKS